MFEYLGQEETAGAGTALVRYGDIATWAAFSPCGTLRYALGRQWDAARPARVMVMLNPSTADHLHDDATLRACLRRAAAAGFGALRVVNLFGHRARHPRDLRNVADPAGPMNDAVICAVTRNCGPVLCAWGAGGALMGRGAAVAAHLRGRGHVLQHLGLTSGGQPRHPLYLGRDVPVQDWP